MAYETGRPTAADPADVSSRDSFGVFVESVLADYLDQGRNEWANPTLERLLDALAAFSAARVVEGVDYDQESASWRLFAEMLVAATGYE